MYGLQRKFGVGQNYLQLWQLNFPTRPTALELSRESKVGFEYTAKVVSEIHLQDEIIDPAEICLGKNTKQGVGNKLTQRKTSFFFPCVPKSQIDPIWIIAESCLPTAAL